MMACPLCRRSNHVLPSASLINTGRRRSRSARTLNATAGPGPATPMPAWDPAGRRGGSILRGPSSSDARPDGRHVGQTCPGWVLGAVHQGGRWIRGVGAFGDSERWRFEWEWSYTRQDWLDQLPTHGGYAQLTPAQLEELLAGIGLPSMRSGAPSPCTTPLWRSSRREPAAPDPAPNPRPPLGIRLFWCREE
jgi:hypothetical protein